MLVHRRQKDVGCPALMLTALAPDILSLTKVGVRLATSKSHSPVSTHNHDGVHTCVLLCEAFYMDLNTGS